MGQMSIRYRGARFWNDIIDEVKGAKAYLLLERVLRKRVEQ